MSESSIDKENLYGRYQRQEDRRNRLSMKMAHKALDIPEDDVQINVQKGMGWKELAIAAALGLGGAGLGAMLTRPTAPISMPAIQTPPAAVPAAVPAARAQPLKGTIRFWVDEKTGKTQIGEQQVKGC